MNAGWRNCKHAPADKASKHCSQINQGDRSTDKQKDGKKIVGKGYFGCARKCRFFEAK
jgi:hypothetical protein